MYYRQIMITEKRQWLEYTSSCRGSGKNNDKKKKKALESLTRSGFAQCPFRAAETFPMIKSFICCVASGLSLIPEGREHCYAVLLLNTKSSWDFSLADDKYTASSHGAQSADVRSLPCTATPSQFCFYQKRAMSTEATHTWSEGTWADGPPPSWWLRPAASCSQTALG